MSCVTGRPSSRAAALTGLGEVALPRPRRRSARVTTSDDVVAGGDERPQRRHGHLGRAEERQAHGVSAGAGGAAAPGRSAGDSCRRRYSAIASRRWSGVMRSNIRIAVEVVELVLEHAGLDLVGLPLDLVAVEVDARSSTVLGRTIST